MNMLNSMNGFIIYIKLNRCAVRTSSSSQSTLDCVDQRVSSLAAESTTEVIQIQTPHHGPTKTTLLQPVNLQHRPRVVLNTGLTQTLKL